MSGRDNVELPGAYLDRGSFHYVVDDAVHLQSGGSVLSGAQRSSTRSSSLDLTVCDCLIVHPVEMSQRCDGHDLRNDATTPAR